MGTPLGEPEIVHPTEGTHPALPRYSLAMHAQLRCTVSAPQVPALVQLPRYRQISVVRTHSSSILPSRFRSMIVHQHVTNKLSTVFLPSIPRLLCWTRPYTTSRVYAAVARASSRVSLSSRWRTTSISLSAESFPMDPPVLCKVKVQHQLGHDLLWRPFSIFFVARARVEKTSPMTFTTISFIATEKGIFTLMSSLLRNPSIDSNNAM